jgi:outer membrane protein insertion porin family
VLVSVRETRRYTFDYGVGFEFQTGQPAVGSNQPLGQTGVSPRVSFGISRLNLGGRHQTVSAKTSLSRLQQRGLISFEAPKLLNRDLHFSIRLLYDNTVDVSTFTSQRTEATLQTVQILKKLDERELDSIAYRFSYRRVQATNIQVADNLVPLLSKPTRVGEPNFLYVRNRRDNDLETNHGSYLTFEGGVAASYFGSEADFSRMLIKQSSYHPFFRNRRTGSSFVFARSTSVGIENPFADTLLVDPVQTLPDSPPLPPGKTLIPLPERFYMGGGSSHRGFGLNQAGPRDLFTGFPIGGSALFLNNFELRFPNVALPYLHDNIGFTIFHDMGNVFARPQEMVRSLGRWHQSHPEVCKTKVNDAYKQCDFNYLSHAIGLGARYQTPIGPLRLDFGYNLNPPFFPSFTNIVNNAHGPPTGQFGFQRAGHFNFSFSIGQSF